jgi:hypothetical protein
MSVARNLVGWIWEHWADIVTWILMLGAFMLAVIPSTIAELEKRPRWGRLWKSGLPLLVILIGFTGFLQSMRSNDKLKAQARQAYSVSLISATKDDIKSLTEHLDEGFENVIAAVNALRTGKMPPPLIKKQPQLPPPVVEHIRYTESRIASSDPSAPYGLQAIIQTDTPIQPVGFKITCDGEITDGNFFVVGQSVMMGVAKGFSQDKKSFLFSFQYPPVKPETPIVVKLQSRTDIRVTKIEQVPPLF